MRRYAVVLLACLAWGQDSPDSVTPGTKQFRKTVVASGLAAPWEVSWGPDNMLWVTERSGKRVTRINPATGKKKVAITIAEISAPGGQNGLLGLAFHPDLLRGAASPYVYVYYTYLDEPRGPRPAVADPRSPFRFLYGKVVRLTWNKATETLSSPQELIAGLPAGNDHVAGRLKIGPDRKLYMTLGDGGHNQLGNFCLPIEAQRLPTRAELDAKRYASYVGKSLRMNLDGSIPADNPKIEGLVSHVFTYGHRNPQGLNFGPDGTLYESEHGPKSDDEVNVLRAGGNYGWPHVAGRKDGNAYEYARWAEASTPCSQLAFSDLAIHPAVPREPESAFVKPMIDPLATMFTVPTGFNFKDPACRGVDYICWPTVGASGIEFYGPRRNGIPGWGKVLLVTTLKRGSLYVLPLAADGKTAAGHFSRYFQSENRYRDTALNPDGRTIYVATDPSGIVQATAGGTTTKLQDPGSILAFTYVGEGKPGEPAVLSNAAPTPAAVPVAASSGPVVSGASPQFTAAQSAAGKTAYNANCAVCHGNTMTNGTFAPPLAGEYFKNTWFDKSLWTFFGKAKAMPPAAPASLSDETYANIVAYILEMNAFKPGGAPLPASAEALGKMAIH